MKYPSIVEVLPANDAATELDDFYLYDTDDSAIQAIDRWVTAHELGRRISYNSWKMRNGAAVTMFLLKWNV